MGVTANGISHPDEIEKKKHFFGQADTHGQVGLKRGSWEGGKLGSWEGVKHESR